MMGGDGGVPYFGGVSMCKAADDWPANENWQPTDMNLASQFQ